MSTNLGSNASELSGKTPMLADGATPHTVTNLFTFDRGAAPPFAVGASSQKVTNLDADKLDGLDSAYFIDQALTQGRLTLSSGVPVPTTDVTAAATLYFTPFRGNKIALYDGAAWSLYTFTEKSIALPAAASQMYDVFGYISGGTLALELTAWTNDTARATALTTQDGVQVKSGAVTRKYLGSVRTTSVAGQSEDSLAKRYVWNAYNRTRRQVKRVETNTSWNYTTNTWRQANGSTANQVAVVQGLAEDALDLHAHITAANSTGSVNLDIAVAEDSTTAPSSDAVYGSQTTNPAGLTVQLHSHFCKVPAVGYHYYPWLEISQVTGTTTWYAANFNAYGQNAGLVGTWAC